MGNLINKQPQSQFIPRINSTIPEDNIDIMELTPMDEYGWCDTHLTLDVNPGDYFFYYNITTQMTSEDAFDSKYLEGRLWDQADEFEVEGSRCYLASWTNLVPVGELFLVTGHIFVAYNAPRATEIKLHVSGYNLQNMLIDAKLSSYGYIKLN